ncbi:MAG: hypothetical protein KGJ02_02140 [Verrucomicrobiota bacterium]|nr:hypothetical protein [Verrucomicrobiota bacterium]
MSFQMPNFLTTRNDQTIKSPEKELHKVKERYEALPKILEIRKYILGTLSCLLSPITCPILCLGEAATCGALNCVKDCLPSRSPDSVKNYEPNWKNSCAKVCYLSGITLYPCTCCYVCNCGAPPEGDEADDACNEHFFLTPAEQEERKNLPGRMLELEKFAPYETFFAGVKYNRRIVDLTFQYL